MRNVMLRQCNFNGEKEPLNFTQFFYIKKGYLPHKTAIAYFADIFCNDNNGTNCIHENKWLRRLKER